jgi:hypothetical protein
MIESKTVRHKSLFDLPNSAFKTYPYLVNYEKYFAPLVGQDIALLELGIDKGGSLLLWRDYFANARIAGLDLKPPRIEDFSGTIKMFQGSQDDTRLLDKIGRTVAPQGFDVIIDDASHIAKLTKVSFWHLFEKHLKPGGIYVIEDWRTGYWSAWDDGEVYKARQTISERIAGRLLYRRPTFPSHQYGMVGFIKQLIDELGVDMITSPLRNSVEPQRYPRFRKIEYFPGQVFVVKATDEDTRLLKIGAAVGLIVNANHGIM